MRLISHANPILLIRFLRIFLAVIFVLGFTNTILFLLNSFPLFIFKLFFSTVNSLSLMFINFHNNVSLYQLQITAFYVMGFVNYIY